MYAVRGRQINHPEVMLMIVHFQTHIHTHQCTPTDIVHSEFTPPSWIAMKTVQFNMAGKPPHIVPVIPFKRAATTQLSKANLLSFKLCSNPSDALSGKYSLTIPYFDTGTPEQLLYFLQDVDKVIIGQAIMTGPNKYVPYCWPLHGNALAAFEEFANKHMETNNNLKAVIGEMKKHIFPKHALAMQKCCMQ